MSGSEPLDPPRRVRPRRTLSNRRRPESHQDRNVTEINKADRPGPQAGIAGPRKSRVSDQVEFESAVQLSRANVGEKDPCEAAAEVAGIALRTVKQES